MAPGLPSADPVEVSWAELDALVAKLAASIGRDQDLVLAITRGGLVSAGILAVSGVGTTLVPSVPSH